MKEKIVPDVIFIKNDKKLEETLKSELKNVFAKGESIAIKLHFGEPGNPYALKPDFVKRFVNVLKEMGTKPFLFDSPVAYPGPRNNEKDYKEAARKMGFSEESMGCRVVISNEGLNVKGKKLTYEICKTLADADGVLVLTHVKGHICCGFGGAIKNLGMGGQTKKTKSLIHNAGKPKYVGGCTLCEMCSSVCPTENIRYAGNRPYFDKSWCCGCSNCVYNCPHHALNVVEEHFNMSLSEAAVCALKNYNKAYFVNVIRNISKNGDCSKDPGPIVLSDVGIIISKDLVAVDKASMDLINQKAGKDLFKEIHKK